MELPHPAIGLHEGSPWAVTGELRNISMQSSTVAPCRANWSSCCSLGLPTTGKCTPEVPTIPPGSCVGWQTRAQHVPFCAHQVPLDLLDGEYMLSMLLSPFESAVSSLEMWNLVQVTAAPKSLHFPFIYCAFKGFALMLLSSCLCPQFPV